MSFLLAACWTSRAIYLHHIWTMAQTWTKLPPAIAPRPVDFFLPDVWGSTYHGVYADVLFLRIRASADLAATLREQWGGGRNHAATALPVAGECNPADRFRIDPSQIAPEHIAPCYSLSRELGVQENTAGTAILVSDRAGGWVSTENSPYLRFAVYRIR